MASLQDALVNRGVTVRSGSEFERWDLHVAWGMLGGASLRLAVEEHGAGRQLARYRLRPHFGRESGFIVVALMLVAGVALVGNALIPAVAVAVPTPVSAAHDETPATEMSIGAHAEAITMASSRTRGPAA